MVALILVAAGCGKDYTGPGEGLESATYNLQLINGQAVPLTAAIRGNVRVEILSATLSIISAYRFTNTTTYRRTENGVTVTQPVETCVGTYIVSPQAKGAKVFFTESGAENASCGVQLSATGVGGRTRSYTGVWDGENGFAIDFDVTTHSVYTK
jgi:hypothetical protein